MNRIIKNILINLLLLSPLFYVIIRYKDHEIFKGFIDFIIFFSILMLGIFSVVFGILRIVISTKEVRERFLVMYKSWKHAKKCAKEDDRLTICSKCKGVGYVDWINNINGKGVK